MIFSFDDARLRSLEPFVPAGHSALVYEVVDASRAVAGQLRAAGMRCTLVELPAPLHAFDPKECSDGYGPSTRVRWALVTVPAGQAHRASVACEAMGLRADSRTGLMCQWPSGTPDALCPACEATVPEAADHCPGCQLRIRSALEDDERREAADFVILRRTDDAS